MSVLQNGIYIYIKYHTETEHVSESIIFFYVWFCSAINGKKTNTVLINIPQIFPGTY